MIRIGKNITRLREQNNMTVKELARKSRIFVRKLTAIEAGEKDFPVDLLIVFAKVLNASYKEILD